MVTRADTETRSWALETRNWQYEDTAITQVAVICMIESQSTLRLDQSQEGCIHATKRIKKMQSKHNLQEKRDSGIQT